MKHIFLHLRTTLASFEIYVILSAVKQVFQNVVPKVLISVNDGRRSKKIVIDRKRSISTFSSFLRVSCYS